MSDKKLCMAGVLAGVLLAGAGLAGRIYGPTVFMGDVSAGSWGAITGISATTTSGGTYTNGATTNYYRVGATNLLGRTPVSSNVVVSFTGTTNGTNAVQLSWPRYEGAASYIIERSLDAGATWTNWIVVGISSTTWTDTGTNTWTGTSAWTSAYSEIPAPSVPWNAGDQAIWQTNATGAYGTHDYVAVGGGLPTTNATLKVQSTNAQASVLFILNPNQGAAAVIAAPAAYNARTRLAHDVGGVQTTVWSYGLHGESNLVFRAGPDGSSSNVLVLDRTTGKITAPWGGLDPDSLAGDTIDDDKVDASLVPVDDTTIEVSGGALQVKSVSGVTGADEDDVTLADVQAAASNDFHNIGGTDRQATVSAGSGGITVTPTTNGAGVVDYEISDDDAGGGAGGGSVSTWWYGPEAFTYIPGSGSSAGGGPSVEDYDSGGVRMYGRASIESGSTLKSRYYQMWVNYPATGTKTNEYNWFVTDTDLTDCKQYIYIYDGGTDLVWSNTAGLGGGSTYTLYSSNFSFTVTNSLVLYRIETWSRSDKVAPIVGMEVWP